MSFLTVNKKDYTQEFSGNGGGNFIRNKSGMYPVKIKHAIVDVSKGGSEVVNLTVDYNGNDNTLFQAYRLSNNNKAPNAIGREQIGKLMVVCGIENVDEPTSVTLALGKDAVAKEYSVMEEFEGCECVMHIKRKYELYNGGITERLQIVNVFEADSFASAVELGKRSEGEEVEIGKQYSIELQSADKDILGPGVTQEMVDAFHAQKRAGNSSKDNKPKSGLGSSGRFSNRG